MNPAFLRFGLLGVAGFAVYKVIEKAKQQQQPKPSDYQSITLQGSIQAPVPQGSTPRPRPKPGIPQDYTLPTPDMPDFVPEPIQGSGSISIPIPVPITVATPVAPVITTAQATATVEKPPVPGPVIPVPTTIPGVGTVMAPPNSVQVTPSGDVTQPAPIVVTPTGSSSIAVGNTLDVQRALNTLGVARPPLVEDGQLGPKTIAAIKSFQSSHHLVVDGTAGIATKAALSAALMTTAGGASLAGAMAQLGNPASGFVAAPTGQQVDTRAALTWKTKDVQHALNLLGAKPPLVEDGSTGPKTVAAIKSFQTASRLDPDGIAGAKTKTALFLAVAQTRT